MTARKHTYQGRGYWVVKEPLGLNYFRFQEEEYAILNMLDGKTSLQDIKERFEKEFAPQKISFTDLQHFIGTLHRSGLVITSAMEQGRQLKVRHDERRWKETVQLMSNVLALRLKGIDPDRLLTAMNPYTKWLFTGPAFIAVMMLCSAAVLLVTVQHDVFVSRLPSFQEFFGPSNWLLLGAVLGVTKICHEFGHGLSCKRYGGECHEMGVMFLVMTPCLYCNVSDSWMLPNKWHRAAIGAAGMYIEVILASIATFIWWFSEPGLLNHLALQVMFVSSVSTVIFNGNPLLRYDGYYILADIMEVPNMRQKASSVLHRYMSKYCLGMDPPEDPFLPERNQFFFGLYTVASNLYRLVVTASIMLFLNQVFKPYGLQVIGQMIALAGIYGLVVMPVYQLWKFLYVPGRMAQVKRKNVLITATTVAAVIAGFVYIPVPQWVMCPVDIQPDDAESVFVVVPGELDQMLVQPGERVTAGTKLARVTNLDLAFELASLENEEQRLVTYADALDNNRLRADDRSMMEQTFAEVQEQLKSIRQQLAKKREQVAQIDVPAPFDGTIFPVPDKQATSGSDGRLPEWSGSIFDDKNRGAHLSTSDVLCRIGNSEQMEAVMYIDQDYIELVHPDQEVEIKLDAFPGKTFKGKIAVMGTKEVEFVPNSLSTQTGGELPTISDPETGRLRPQNATFPAQVPLPSGEQGLKLGMRGEAKIWVQWEPLGTRLWRYLSRTFHFYL
ncbi:hemolysin D [Blastopirellula marina]|uniref:hemolysin D n=1 Tax=Blastopirellula marina TaxID=124 RepID=UPI001E585EA5|nr:hemolysin D [Blastopirellula marina]